MKKITRIFFIIFWSNFVFAQSPCEGRYNEEIFDQVAVIENLTYSAKKDKYLRSN